MEQMQCLWTLKQNIHTVTTVSSRVHTEHIATVSLNMSQHTYLLTPWNRFLLEKLTGSAASQEIPRIFGTRRFITVLTSARHLSLSWANSIQSPQPSPTSWRSFLILSSYLANSLTTAVSEPALYRLPGIFTKIKLIQNLRNFSYFGMVCLPYSLQNLESFTFVAPIKYNPST